MCKATLNQRLDLAMHVLSEREDRSYCDALAMHHKARAVVDHLIEVAGRPAGGLRYAPTMLAAMWLTYEAEHVAEWVPVRLGNRDGVSVHFLAWAESRLPGGSMSRNLLWLVQRSLARWREANPGLVPEASGTGYCAV